MGSKVEITLSVTSTSEKWKFLLQNHRSRCAYSGKSERQFRDIGTAFRFKQNE